MRVILAGPRGFCAGVNRAIETLDLAIRTFGAPIYVFHEIVHNRHVVDSFREQGTVFVESLEDVPQGSILLFSAHGVSPAVRARAGELGIEAVDATCPLVTKVHLKARRFARDGYTIVLIGHKGHDEVVGTMAEAPHAMHLVETVEDVDRLDLPDGSRVAYLTQTTLSVNDAGRIVERLRQRFSPLVGPRRDDICYATQNRQQAVRVLAGEADVVLVVGSQNSSNSRRLQEIAAECGSAAYLIEGAESIENDWFAPHDTVLVTAGASAPESVVQGCVDWLREHFSATVESRCLCGEETRFPLPRLPRDAGQD